MGVCLTKYDEMAFSVTTRPCRQCHCQKQRGCFGAYSFFLPRLQSSAALIFLRLGHYIFRSLVASASSDGNALRHCSASNASQKDETSLWFGCMMTDLWLSRDDNNPYPVVLNLKPGEFPTIVKCCRQECTNHVTYVILTIGGSSDPYDYFLLLTYHPGSSKTRCQSPSSRKMMDPVTIIEPNNFIVQP